MSVMTFESLSSGIEDELGTFMDKVEAEVARIAGMLNDATEGVGGFLDDILPGDTVARAIDKWNNEILPAINDMIEQVFTKVRDAVGDLAGRPANLLEYSSAFNQVKRQVYTAGDMSQKLTLMQGSWSGRAFANFSAVATSQDNALRDFSLPMDAGATATS